MSVSPLPVSPYGVYAKLEALATCLCAQIALDGLPACCFCGLMPGELVPFDYIDTCDDDLCGLAWVRLLTVQPTTGIGVISETVNNCDAELGFQVEVGIVRCFTAGDTTGNPPTAAENLAATQLQIADMECMRRALSCCDIGDIILDNYTPIGPDGMALGGVWVATLGES